MSITATVRDDTIQLPPGVHLPDGARVRIELLDAPAAASVEAWLEKARGAAGAGLTTDEVMRLTRGET